MRWEKNKKILEELGGGKGGKTINDKKKEFEIFKWEYFLGHVISILETKITQKKKFNNLIVILHNVQIIQLTYKNKEK